METARSEPWWEERETSKLKILEDVNAYVDSDLGRDQDNTFFVVFSL
jgi:hypothetical protein